VLDRNRCYVNQNPMCEPQLGKRGLYDAIGGQSHTKDAQLAMLWVLNQSDGRHTLLDIADRAGMRFDLMASTAEVLEDHGLLKESAGDGEDGCRCPR